MAGHVARGQRRARLVGGQHQRAADALVEQRVGELLALARTAAHDLVQLEDEHHQAEANPGGLDALRGKRLADGRARHELAATEGLLDDPAGAGHQRGVDLVGPVHGARPQLDARRHRREHPAGVGLRDEVPRRPRSVRADDRAVGQRPIELGVGQPRRPQRQRPLGALVVLRLDGAEPGDDGGGIGRHRRGETLRAHPARDERIGRGRHQEWIFTRTRTSAGGSGSIVTKVGSPAKRRPRTATRDPAGCGPVNVPGAAPASAVFTTTRNSSPTRDSSPATTTCPPRAAVAVRVHDDDRFVGVEDARPGDQLAGRRQREVAEHADGALVLASDAQHGMRARASRTAPRCGGRPGWSDRRRACRRCRTARSRAASRRARAPACRGPRRAARAGGPARTSPRAGSDRSGPSRARRGSGAGSRPARRTPARIRSRCTGCRARTAGSPSPPTICRSFTGEASGISAEKRSLRPNTWSWSSTIETWRSPKARCDSKPLARFVERAEVVGRRAQALGDVGQDQAGAADVEGGGEVAPGRGEVIDDEVLRRRRRRQSRRRSGSCACRGDRRTRAARRRSCAPPRATGASPCRGGSRRSR